MGRIISVHATKRFQIPAIPAALLLLLLWPGLTGCEESARGPQARHAVDGSTEPLALDQPDPAAQPIVGSMDVSDMARQFERDLDDFAKLNERRIANAPAATGDQPFPQRPHQPGRPVVRFNTPDHRESDSNRPPTDDEPDPTRGEGDVSIAQAPSKDERGEVESLDVAGAVGSPEARMREAMVNLRRELYHDAAYASQPLRQYMTMAALTLVDPDRSIDPDAFPDLNARERDILRAYQEFFTSLGREIHDAGDQAKLAALIEQLRTALIDEPPLRIARAELCTRVDGFGSFEIFDKNTFLAGTAQEVVIYSEIEHFKSMQNEADQWVTDLWQELIIYNSADNVPVWHQQWLPAPDRSARRRTDFFISYLVTLPDRLTVGRYTLKVRVRDEASGMVAETGIPFQIVADPKLTASQAMH